MNRLKTRRSARWGAACAACAAAKTRCIRTQSSGRSQCDRCRSLERECVGQTPGPRKKRQTKSCTNLDTIRACSLEQLDNTIPPSRALRQEDSSAKGTPFNVSLDYLAGSHSASSLSTETQPQAAPSQEEFDPKIPTQDFNSNAPERPTCTCMAAVDMEDLVAVESDETLLSIYRNQLSPQFPFVIIPPDTTPSQLQATRPFLMKVIRMVSSVRHLRLVRGQSRAVLEHVFNAILMRSERSLDLVQGILVFLGAYHYHCMAHAQFNTLVRLAVSLVEDVNWTTCPKSQQRENQQPFVRAEKPMSRTNEEKRALLGVWYLSSNAGLVVKQLAFTQYTKCVDQCLKDLEQARVKRSSTFTTLRVELEALQKALPLSLKSDSLLSCYYNIAYLWIFEPLLAGSHLPDADPQSFASLSVSGVSVSEVFSHFTAALKAWLENWLAIPVCSYFYIPQPAYVMLVHSAMMLSRWVRIAGPNAAKSSGAATAVSHKEFLAPSRPIPALSGVPPCPDLSQPRPPASISTHVVSAQILDTLRAEISAQASLQIDIYGILETMAARFEAAKKEIAAAQGLPWENNTWDFAAEHLKMKKVRVEKWRDIVARAADMQATVHDDISDVGRQTVNALAGQSSNDLEWETLSPSWNNIEWESAMFDEILRDIHTGAVFKSVDWNAGMPVNL